jgi:glycosyltransferase involved in cell wall biosynthesis
MRVLILESTMSGHHRVYLERIAGALMDAGAAVTIAIDSSQWDVSSITSVERALGGRCSVIQIHFDAFGRAIRRHLGHAGREVAYWRLWARVVREQLPGGVDCVVVPYLDYCLYACGLLGSPFASVPWIGICMRPSFHHPKAGIGGAYTKTESVKEALFVRLVRNAKRMRLLCLDPLLPDHVNSKVAAAQGVLRHVPDPADPPLPFAQSEARSQLSIPAAAEVVLVYGALDERKSIDVLFRVLARVPACSRVHALIVGTPDAATRSLLGMADAQALRSQGRLHLFSGYATDELEGLAFAATDVVWARYRNHRSMSGVIVKAAMACRASIVSEEGLAAWYAVQSGWGPAVNDRADDREIAVRLMDSMELSRNLPKSLGERAMAEHNWTRMAGEIVGFCKHSSGRLA